MDSLSFCRLKQQKLVLYTHLSVHCTCIICVCVGVCACSQEGKVLKWPYVSYDPPHCVPRDFGPPMSKEQKTGKDDDSGRKKGAGGVGLVCF